LDAIILQNFLDICGDDAMAQVNYDAAAIIFKKDKE
jgi:hypothetical protein